MTRVQKLKALRVFAVEQDLLVDSNSAKEHQKLKSDRLRPDQLESQYPCGNQATWKPLTSKQLSHKRYTKSARRGTRYNGFRKVA